MRQAPNDDARSFWGERFSALSALRWWYRLTTPAEPPVDASFDQRETARQARLTSTILLLSLLVLFAVFAGSLLDMNGILLLVIIIALLIQVVAILLNRHSKVTWAGLLVVAWFEVGLSMFLFTIPGGLSVANLTAFYLFIEPELLAVSLLPAWSVFPVLLLNSLLIISDLTMRPHTAELDRLLATSGYQVIGQPILLQIMVAVIAYLWVRSATQAIARADRAEEIAQLQQTIAQQNQQRLEALQAERQATLAYEEQRKINQLKDQFIANVNHELRTPLMTIGGYLEFLKERYEHLDPAKQVQFLTRALESHQELCHLVNTMLDAMTITRETPSVRYEVVSVCRMVQDVIEHLDPRDVQAFTIRVHICEQLTIWTDPQYFRQVLRNLLSNACKYAPQQTVISIEATQDEATSQVCICVQDAGPGIPPEEITLLFERFVRLKRDLGGAKRGTGLGLYISKQLVEAMGGHIWVKSSGRMGEGSRFCFTLPLPSSSSPHLSL